MGSQKDTATSLSFKKSLGISFGLHAAILGFLLLSLRGDVERAAGYGESEIISVSLIAGSKSSEQFPFAKGANEPGEKSLSEAPATAGVMETAGAESGVGVLGRSRRVEAPGEGSGEGGLSTILQQIRNQIERHKHYPLMAKRSRIEGSPQVEFKIKTDGALEYVSLKQSSGSKMLDEAATLTVHQAAPYPFYPEPIALAIHYTLAP